MAKWIKLKDNLGQIRYFNLDQASKIIIISPTSISFYFSDGNPISMPCTQEFIERIEAIINNDLVG